MAQQWRNVAIRVRKQRASLKLTQEQLAARANVGTATVRKLETAKQDEYYPSTLAAVGRALWGDEEAIDRLLRGEEPVAEMDAPSIAGLLEQQATAIAELTRLVEELVADGVLLKPRQPNEQARP